MVTRERVTREDQLCIFLVSVAPLMSSSRVSRAWRASFSMRVSCWPAR